MLSGNTYNAGLNGILRSLLSDCHKVYIIIYMLGQYSTQSQSFRQVSLPLNSRRTCLDDFFKLISLCLISLTVLLIDSSYYTIFSISYVSLMSFYVYYFIILSPYYHYYTAIVISITILLHSRYSSLCTTSPFLLVSLSSSS